MEWILKFTNNKNIRILVKFNPIEEILIYNGQFKINILWYDIHTISIPINEINGFTIKEKITILYDLMKPKIDLYLELDETFKSINSIEIFDENEESED